MITVREAVKKIISATMHLLLLTGLIIVCVPPGAYVSGRALCLFTTLPPHVVLLLSCGFSACAVAAVYLLFIRHRAFRPFSCRYIAVCMVIIGCFALFVSFPRTLSLHPETPAAIYDDNWHYQKTVSVAGSFPQIKHYLFPEYVLSYYFYGYIIPAALYSSKIGLNLKLIWALYIFICAASLPVLCMVCCSPFLPHSFFSRVFFVLCMTFIGGLHEWPCFLYRRLSGSANWHTEWWAAAVGVQQQVSSFFSTFFWAPQHACALGLFAVMFFVLHTYKRSGYAGLACGALAGVQAGFSVYVSAFSFLYIITAVMYEHKANFTAGVWKLVMAGAGCALGIAPILNHLLFRKGNLSLDVDVTELLLSPVFLFVELGGLLVLFIAYAANALSARRATCAFSIPIVCFVSVSAVLVFVFASEGFNVYSYRSFLPAQLLIYFAAATSVSVMFRGSILLRSAVVFLICVQLSGFIPEFIAMTKKNIDCSQKRILPDFIVTINRTAPFSQVFDIPYKKNVSDIQLNIAVHNIFRLKNLSKQFVCDGSLDRNNMVYLNTIAVERLKERCAQQSAR